MESQALGALTCTNIKKSRLSRIQTSGWENCATSSLEHHAHNQKHLRCTTVGPDSSYSAFEIHMFSNVDSDDKIEPPMKTEYFRSLGAETLTSMDEGAREVSSLVMRSSILSNMVLPPDSTILA